MTTEAERLATLEEMSHNASKERAEILNKQERHDEALDAIQDDMHAIRQQIERYKGFWGGIVFAFSCAAGFLGMVASALKERLFG